MQITKTIFIYTKKNIEYIVFIILIIILVILISKRNFEGFFSEQNGINRLDAIIYINLENRKDRKDLLLAELESLNTNMSKVHKVSGVYMPKNGHKGCIQSHILALNMIKLNKWNRVLILEDDAELDTTPDIVNNIINNALDTLDAQNPNWNVIMLATANKILVKSGNSYDLNISTGNGGNGGNGGNDDENNNNINTDNIKIEKLISATTSSAYIVKESYVDSILDLFKTCNNNMKHNMLSGNKFEYWALDQKWASLQKKDNWYAISPDPIKQRAIWSTILNESHK